MQNWKMGSQVAKTGKKTINETKLTDKGCSRTRPGRPLADISWGVSTGDLKRPEKPVIILSLTWAWVNHLGLHFRVGQTWTFLVVGWIPNRGGFGALDPGGLGLWWVFTLVI